MTRWLPILAVVSFVVLGGGLKDQFIRRIAEEPIYSIPVPSFSEWNPCFYGGERITKSVPVPIFEGVDIIDLTKNIEPLGSIYTDNLHQFFLCERFVAFAP
jgi:hypothetical protein